MGIEVSDEKINIHCGSNKLLVLLYLTQEITFISTIKKTDPQLVSFQCPIYSSSFKIKAFSRADLPLILEWHLGYFQPMLLIFKFSQPPFPRMPLSRHLSLTYQDFLPLLYLTIPFRNQTISFTDHKTPC